MSIFTLTALMNGEEGVVQYYQNAVEIWKDIVESDDFHDWDLLLYRIQLEEIRFRHRCGSKYLHKEIMAIVGLLQFYYDYIGFDGTYEDALRVKRAVMESDVTIEVKWFIEKAALQFKLTDDYQPDWAKDNFGHLFQSPEEGDEPDVWG
jgi:hypothetical protein